MQKAAIFGYGNMGAAFAQAMHRTYPAADLLVAEVSADRADAAEREVSATTVSLADAAATGSDRSPAAAAVKEFAPEVILLAVKPFQFTELAAVLKPVCGSALVISLMAGVDLATLQQELATSRVVRFLPNLAAAYGKSVTAVSPAAGLDTDSVALAAGIAEAAGTAVQLPERLISSLIGISGSGIAFAFQFMHALALGGTRAGISYPQSLEAAAATLEGAAAAVRSSGINPAEFVTRVCSPGGTTIEGISALENHGFTSAVLHAVRAAEQRSREMEQK